MASSCCYPSVVRATLAKRPRECHREGSCDPESAKQECHNESKSLVTAIGATDGDHDDVLISSGIALPAFFQTKFRRWVMLLVFCILNSFTSGPLMMFAALEPILVQEKVFEGPDQMIQLSMVLSVTLGTTMLAYLPVAMLYDRYGPKWLSVTLTWVFVILGIGIGFAIRVESLNWMLYVLYPAIALAGYCQSMGGYGWQWLLPESQNTVNSLVAAIQVLSDSLVIVCVWLHNTYGMSLWTYFWALSVVSVVVAFFNSLVVPSQKEHFTYAAVVVAAQKSIESGYGGTDQGRDAERSKENPITSSGWRWWDNVKGLANTFRNYPVENTFFVIGSLCAWNSMVFYGIQMYPFYLKMFGTAEAKTMVNIFAMIFGCFGAILTILNGRFADFFGLEKMTIACVIAVLIASVAVNVPTRAAQICVQVTSTFVSSVYMIIIFRFCMIYAPVNLLGTYVGVITLFMGVIQLGFPTIVSAFVPDLMRLHILSFVRTTFVVFGFLSAISFLGLLIFWRYKPPPLVGSVTCHDAGIPEEDEYEVPETFSGDKDAGRF